MKKRSIEKVTDTKVTKVRSIYTVYNLQLNGKIWVTCLAPRKKYERKQCTLYQAVALNGNDLSFMIGSFVDLTLSNSGQYINFTIHSINPIKEFHEKLESASWKRSFFCGKQIFDFLIRCGRKIESDGSIILNSDKGDIRVSNNGICYEQPCDINKFLTPENIELVFESLYKNKIEKSNRDNLSDSNYRISIRDCGIVEEYTRYYRSSDKITASANRPEKITRTVLRVGDEIPKNI